MHFIGKLWIPVILFASLSLSACGGAATQAPPPPTAVPTSTPPPPTATAIVHQLVPGALPPERSDLAGDYDSSTTADKRTAPGGDRFTLGRFERPFNADTMDEYYPYLDIQKAVVYEDDTWLYAVISLKDGDANGALPGRYAEEIDTDQDGRGDWLVLVDSPAGTEWSTDGVSAWFDSNDDVGGATVMISDEGTFSDGYNLQKVADGQGDDPDLAWARLSPDEPFTVQLAIKRAILEGDSDFMLGVWAGGDLLDPARFDINDQFTHEQAGAALADLEFFYPIKAVDRLDNSCRMAVGFVPTGTEPGLCPLPPDQAAGCQGQTICFNFGNQTVCSCVE